MAKATKYFSTLRPLIVSLTNWLEDCTNLYVQLIYNPGGIGFPDDASPETTKDTVRASVRVDDLRQVLVEHIRENIWRSWQLFSDESCSTAVSRVPLIIDIDNEERNLEGAYNLTRDCLDWIEGTNKYPAPDHLRVVFSGMKGFHIEAKPTETIDYRSFRKSLLAGLKEMGLEQRWASNCFLSGTIDLGHDFIRLTGSFNTWREDSILKKRRVIQLSLNDFRSLHLEQILERSEAA